MYRLFKYIVLFIKLKLVEWLFSTLLRDRVARRIGNCLYVPFYNANRWDSILVPYSNSSTDQYVNVKYYDDKDKLILSYSVPQGMRLLVTVDDVGAAYMRRSDEIEDE